MTYFETMELTHYLSHRAAIATSQVQVECLWSLIDVVEAERREIVAAERLEEARRLVASAA